MDEKRGHKMTKYFWILCAGLFLSGCAGLNKSVPVGLDIAVIGLERDIRSLGFVTISDLLSENAENRKNAESYIRSKQCFFGRPNPILVSFLQSNLTFTLKGAFTQSGEFKIAGFPTVIEGGFGGSTQSEQTLSWPVEVASLSSVPELYLDQRVKALGELKGLTDANKKIVFDDIINERTKLKERIKQLEDSFDIKNCPRSEPKKSS